MTKQGIKPDPLKTDKIRNYPAPVSVTQVRQFLGLASYYRRFVQGFSGIASPLHLLLKRDAVFQWTTECQNAFNQLKDSCPSVGLSTIPAQSPFHLASAKGLGAVLAQQQEDGQVHPIAFTSRSLTASKRTYGITELETLKLVWAAKMFRPYILGHSCVAFTDHAACMSLQNVAHPSSKLAGWAMAIQELDMNIRHRSGKSNRVADTLYPGILFRSQIYCRWKRKV